MPTSCIAYGCFNKGKIDGITYHSFPQDEETKQKWINATKRKNWEPKKSSKICSAHFREADIDRTSLCRVRIREGAVPAIFKAFPEESQVKERRPLKRKSPPVVSAASGSNYSPTKKLKSDLNIVKSKLASSKRKIKTLQQSKRRLKQKVTSLEAILESLRQKLNFSSDDCNFLTSISKDSDCLIKRAVEKTQNPKLKKVYDERLKAFAITLHFLSPKAYLFVRKTFNTALPHPKTLGRWYSSVNAEPGFCQEAFRALKEHASKVSKQPICSLMFDCMAVRKKLEWDGQRFHGTVNVGDTPVDDDAAPIASEALVFHLVSVTSSWKIPLGHFFVASTKGNQLSGLVNHCLNLLHDAGIKVVSLTCDGTGCNITMANDLGCSFKDDNLVHWFPHPETKERIFFFPDPSHMLKLVRNTLGDYKVLFDASDRRIEWQYIKKLHELQKEEGLRLGNKLTDSHVMYVKQKMKTKLAAQLLSSSVADSLEYLLVNEVKGFEDCSGTIEFLRTFDVLFDILNSRSIKAKYSKQALYPGNYKKHSEILLKAKDYIYGLKIKDETGNFKSILKSQRKTGFLGLVTCITSSLEMYSKYVERIEGSTAPLLMYLPLYKLSQDHIERLFGYVRSRGGHNNNPSCKEFTATFKRILLHKELHETNTGNALVLDKSYILSFNKTQNEVQSINSSTPGWRSFEPDDLNAIDNEDDNDDIFLSILDNASNVHTSDHIVQICTMWSLVHTNIVEYIAGFIVRSLRQKIVCKTCSDLLMTNVTNNFSLIYAKNRGGLVQPSEGVVKLCLLADTIVKYHVHKGDITTRPNLVDVMVMSVMRKCVGVTIFPEEHCFEQEPEQNHLIPLMKLICKKFFRVRLYHYSKTVSETLHKTKLRSYLAKTVTFMGQ